MHAHCLFNPDLEEVRSQLESGHFFWMDFEDADADTLHQLGELLHLHPLTVEDLQSFRQNPRFDEFAGYAYMVAYGVDPGVEAGSPLLREVHLVVSGDYVVTVHQHAIEALTSVRDRYSDVEMRSEQQLIYRILDALAGTFFPVLARIDDEIDEIEDDVLERASTDSLERIFSLKRDLVAMRRVVTPIARRIRSPRRADRGAARNGGRPHPLFPGSLRHDDPRFRPGRLLPGPAQRRHRHVPGDGRQPAGPDQQAAHDHRDDLPAVDVPDRLLRPELQYLVHGIDTTWSFFVFGLGLLAVSLVVLPLALPAQPLALSPGSGGRDQHLQRIGRRRFGQMEDPMPLGDAAEIPLSEVTLRASRSSGPGGQHANVTASRIEAVFDVAASSSLTDEQKRLLVSRLGPLVVAVAQDARSQRQNRELALARLQRRLQSALHVAAPRTATRPTKASERRRLEAKRIQGRAQAPAPKPGCRR